MLASVQPRLRKQRLHYSEVASARLSDILDGNAKVADEPSGWITCEEQGGLSREQILLYYILHCCRALDRSELLGFGRCPAIAFMQPD